MPFAYSPAEAHADRTTSVLRTFFTLLLAVIIAFAAYCVIIVSAVEPFIYSQEGRIEEIFNFYEKPHGSNMILFIGSSQIREGIDAYVIENGTGDRFDVFNMGFTSDTPLRRLTELAQIIRNRPKAVFIGLTLFGVSNETAIPEDQLALVSDKIHLDGYSRTLLGRQNLAAIDMNWFGRLVYKRKFFLPMMLDGLKAMKNAVNSMFNQTIVAIDYANTLSNFKNPNQYNEDQSIDVLKEKLRQNRDVLDTYIISNETNNNRKALIYLIQKLKENNISVMLIDVPIHPLLYQSIPDSSISYYNSFLDAYIKPAVDGYYSYMTGFDESKFIDLSHLNAAGRDELSGAMAGIINGVL